MSHARQPAAVIVAVAAAVAALLLVRPSIGRACSPIGPTQHQVNAALAATDTAAPALTEQTDVQPHISDSEGSGCFGEGKCGSGSLINLKVTVVDDQSPPDRIGYRLRVVGGTLPPGIFVPQFDTGAFNNLIPLPWDPEASDSFRFELSVAPVDEAGNVGDAQRVAVQRSGDGGCAIHPGAGGGDPMFRIAALAVVAAAMLMLRRRRRAK